GITDLEQYAVTPGGPLQKDLLHFFFSKYYVVWLVVGIDLYFMMIVCNVGIIVTRDGVGKCVLDKLL
ncbi:MAG: hypothetical protein H7257_01195, partial [Taibaiella sp.]|nr:hypothetical protein [Taibaiella sp.]